MRGCFGAQLLVPAAGDYRLDIELSAGGGPVRAVMGPAPGQAPFSLGSLVNGIAEALGLGDQLGPVTTLAASPPWDGIFETRIAPYVTVEVSSTPSVQLLVQLYDGAGTYGVTIGSTGKSWLRIEPSFTVYDLIVNYDKVNGVDVRARVEILNQAGATLPPGVTAPPPKSEIVSYPFPAPPPRSANLKVHYVGLGQRFGPTPEMLVGDDPLQAMFTALETTFQANDPTSVVSGLAKCYQPDRDWFVALDVELRGWRVRAVFNDPALYGLEVTCDEGEFAGLLFEVLYQKLSPGLGVYYGALTLPELFRRVQLGAVTLVLPSFRIWVYTNGDFKVCVGWPIGPESIGIEVGIFTGGGGFYFAKLRSGDNPASTTDPKVPAYAPILEFGIGVWLGLGRSFSSGPFSASLSLTMQGTFQGVIAWCAPPADDPDGAKPASLPDYYWFAATVGLVGQLQGEVDLKVVKLSVLVRLSVTAAVAVETGYGTAVTVSASVDVEASLRILFVTITVGFHATISQTFELFSGAPGKWASVDGPQTAPFAGMNDAALPAPAVPAMSGTEALVALPGATLPSVATRPVDVDLYVLLQPTAVYAGGTSSTAAVVSLLVETTPPEHAKESPLATLLTALESWLLHTYARATGSWADVVKALGSGRDPEPVDWDEALTTFLTTEVRFTLHPLDLATVRTDGWQVAVFPMFDELSVAWNGGDPVPFATTARTKPHYVDVVEAYYAELSLSTATANPDPRGTERFGAAAAGDGADGHSLASFVFDDYFLTVARHVATVLASGDAEGLVGDVAGLTSRYLLNGLRLPDPATTPPEVPDDLTAGYLLDGQQVPATGTGAFTATLSLTTPPPEGTTPWLTFAGGDSVTSSMPLGTPPAEPVPAWNGTGANALSVAALPAAHEQPCWSAQRTRLPWQATTDGGAVQRLLVPLPPDVLGTTAAGGVTLTVQTAPPGTKPPGTVAAVRPVLTIPLTLHLVSRTPAGTLVDGTVQDPHLTYVYRVDGTDDATRTRIEALIAGGADLAGATVDLLRDADTTGYVSDLLDPAAHPVLLAKTNLSTTTAPSPANVLMVRLDVTADTDPIGPVSAAFTPDGYADLLRLVWEASVVHTGGFYLRYQTAAGDPLPAALFERQGGSAAVTLAVTFPAGGTFEAWHDSFVIDPLPASTGTLYLGSATAAGPVRSLQPSYPPGCVAFRAAWSGDAPLAAAADDLYTDAWIRSLYHLLQFRVDGAGSGQPFRTSLWSVALSETNDPDTGGTSYRQVVPVSKLTGSGTDPYAAAGGTPLLEFRIDDVFGNVLDDDATYTAAFPVTYSDPLLVPGAWTGVRIRYSFQPAGAMYRGETLAAPSLCLSLSFDPAAAGKPRSDQRAAVLFAYRTIAAQLADIRVTTVLATTVLPSNDGVIDDGTVLRPKLAAFVAAVIALLESSSATGTDPVTTSFAVPIDPADLAKQADDVFPVGVTVTFARPPDLVYALDGVRVPGSDTATTNVPADLDPPPEGTARAQQRAAVAAALAAAAPDDAPPPPSPPPPVDVTLTAFATAFESVFARFDGAEGQARVAVRTGTPDPAAPSDGPGIWAIRWSQSAGIHVTFLEDGVPAYFSMVPLSVAPVGGDAMVVTGYDHSTWEATTAPATYSGIDLDAWAREFLAAADRLSAPDLATSAAATAPGTYELLMLAKSVLAASLANGVEPVFPSQPAGDRAAARDELEQAALATLSTAYGISSVVQVPAAIAVAGQAERGAPVPPRLFGSLEAVPAAPVTLTTAKLSLAPSTDAAPAYLTFLVTAVAPAAAADLPMTVTYRPRFVEHAMDRADEHYGYVPSQWLRVALSPPGDVLDLTLPAVDAPVPSRDAPAVPSLSGQSATQPDGGPLFAWDYGVTLSMPDAEAQDALWLDVTYNLPVAAPAARAAAAAADPVTGLFQALASFTSAWPLLSPEVETIAAAQENDAPATATVLDAVWEQVRGVAEAWAALRGVAVPWTSAPPDVALLAEPEPVVSETDLYVVDLSAMAHGTLNIRTKAQPDGNGGYDPATICWPTVAAGSGVAVSAGTVSPAPEPGWYTAPYAVGAMPAGAPLPLALCWPGLDALTRQTAMTSCYVVRNADLSEPPRPVDRAFVYRTAVAAFPSPVVPLMVVPEMPISPAGATLAGTLATALADVARSGSVEADRFLRLEMRYSYRLGAEPGTRASTAVLLANDVHLLPVGALPASDAVTLATLCTRLAGSADTWFGSAGPVTTEALLEMSVVVFATVAGSSLPLVRFDSVPVAVPDGWWAS